MAWIAGFADGFETPCICSLRLLFGGWGCTVLVPGFEFLAWPGECGLAAGLNTSSLLCTGSVSLAFQHSIL